MARTSVGPNGFTLHNDARTGRFDVWGHGNPPPFQIEANFGLVAAMQQMLLQSRESEIRLLPALPQRWSHGELRGQLARGAVQVDLGVVEERPKMASDSVRARRGSGIEHPA